RVELEERLLPRAGDGLRGERLSTSLHADDENSPGSRKIERARFAREPDARPFQPGLQAIEASELEGVVFGRMELEQSLLSYRLALPPQHARDVLRRQRIVIEHGPRHRLPRLVQ